MYFVTKRLEVSGAHFLNLDYESKCAEVHGHNWIITVFCKSQELDDNGMVIDFNAIKDVVNRLDHKNINEVLEGLNPTAENIAWWIQCKVPCCYRVSVLESSGNEAIYESDSI